MEEAKSTIKNLTSTHGKHSTTVHEHHQPSVTHQHVTPTRHDEGTTVVDKEVHQDHFHTSVQPIHQREVLPEQHKHKLLPTQEQEFHHGDSGALKQRLATDAAKYKDATETGATKFTSAVSPEIGGQHVHHHMHETIQPVVQKETIQPTVVHTTQPVHEVHHNEAQHHAATILPAVNINDFQHKGGSLTGAKDRVTHYEGEPGRHGLINEPRDGAHHGGHYDGNHDAHHGAHHGHSGGVGAAGAAGAGGAAGIAATTGSGPTGRLTNDGSVMNRERPHNGHAGATMNTAGDLGGNHREHHTHDREHHTHDKHHAHGTAAAMDSRVDPRRNDIPNAQDLSSRGGAGVGAGAGAGAGVGAIAGERREYDRRAVPGTEDRALHSKNNAPTREFADTHLGSGASGNTTGVSNFESANIRHGDDEHVEKKKTSLLDKLNPLK